MLRILVAAVICTFFKEYLSKHLIFNLHLIELAVRKYFLKHFKIFMNKFYFLYHQSPKNSNQLKNIESLLKMCRIL